MTTICFFITHIKLTYRLPHISNFMQVSFRAQWLDRFVPWLRRNVLFTRCIFIWHATRPTISCMYIYCVLGRSRSTDCLWFVICQGALLVSQPIPSVTIQPSSPNNPPPVRKFLRHLSFSQFRQLCKYPTDEVGWQMYPKSHGMANKNIQKTVPHVARLKLNFLANKLKSKMKIYNWCNWNGIKLPNQPPESPRVQAVSLCRKQAVSSFLLQPGF